MDIIQIEKSCTDDLMDLIEEHIRSFANPPDSWLEEQMSDGNIYCFIKDDKYVGYCSVKDETMNCFYVKKLYFADAPTILEQAIKELGILKVLVVSQDSAICALITEWVYEVKRNACFFIDSERSVDTACKAEKALFRKAETEDCDKIRHVAGNFFDEVSSGFSCLEERIEAKTIFVLEENEEMLGGGIIENGRLCNDCISIGMFTNPMHRQKGVAKTILLHLKKYVYSKGKKPVAGCWYYNTLSRKSLESAGMIAASLGFEAVLIKKDRPPKRTGNPPGELVD